MNSPGKILNGIGLRLLVLAFASQSLFASARALHRGRASSVSLESLASESAEPRTWPALRRFARAASDFETRGRAFFLLGYRESEAKDFAAAEVDLRQAAATKFSLADFAEYYLVSAQETQGEFGPAADAVAGFAGRYPHSALSSDALALFAKASTEDGRPQVAIQALAAEPDLHSRPDLILLLAQAYQRAEEWEDAAKTFQEIYYRFPAAREAGSAGAALNELEIRVGEGKYPAPTIEMLSNRADILFQRRLYSGALNAYNSLSEKNPSNPEVPLWTVRRARCLFHLYRGEEALDLLQSPIPNNPEADAQRLAALAVDYFRRDDPDAAQMLINQLQSLYPQSHSYARALFAAGDYYVRRMDWPTAARYYAPLADSFPKTDQGEEAAWRLAWNSYLAGDRAKASSAFLNFLSQYPDSAHDAGAVYWLARAKELSEDRGQTGRLYQFVIARYSASYYADQARARLKEMQSTPRVLPAKESAGPSLAEELAQKLPPLAPVPADLCSHPPSDALLQPYLVLRSLTLDDLAALYLRRLLNGHEASPELLFALAQAEYGRGHYAASVVEAQRAVPDFFDYDFSAFPADLWDSLYPRTYWRLVESDARARGLDPFLVMGLIREESAFNPRARSVANARGLMQLLPGTARRVAHRRSAAWYLYNPAYNLRLGTVYIGALSRNYDGNAEEAVAAYHAGQNRVDDWLSERSFHDPAEFMESIPIPSTRAYVEKVLRDARIYRRLLTGSADFKRCE